MLRVKISVFGVGGKSRENQSNWIVWMLKGISGEADFKVVWIALPQQGQPDFAWAGSEELKQADPHTLLAAHTDPDCSLEQLSSGYFPVYWVVTCPWHIPSELMFDSWIHQKVLWFGESLISGNFRTQAASCTIWTDLPISIRTWQKSRSLQDIYIPACFMKASS